jgi:replicative DNA helicase Mcm
MEKIDLAPLISLFTEFFTSIYNQRLNELLLAYPQKRSLVVSYGDLEKFDPDLADKLIHEPDVVIEAAETAIKEMKPTLPSSIGEFSPHVRFADLPSSDTPIEQLSSKNLNELVAFKGVVTRRADVMHRVKIALYRCQICDSEVRVLVTKNFVEPKRCESCKKSLTLKKVEDESRFVDVQRAEVQELLERVRGGAPAAHIELWLEDDLVNTISPGDNIEVTAILRLRPPLRLRQKQELIYGRYAEVVYIKSLKRDFEEIEITKEDERRILELAKDPNIEEMIVRSIAPAIYGHEEVKRALALQLFGGTRGKKMPGGLPIRDDIHILLIGDPGIAKTRFLQQIAEIAPKSIYVSGKSTTGAGLTVSAEKDELGDGGWVLKAGALVLASGGTISIDEFDKIDEEDRAALHEAMEIAQISVAKAGIVAKFRAKTAVLAAANPRYGRFDQTRNLAEQFEISPTLLSRFDLIFPIVDILDEEKDSKLASHILASHAGKMSGDESRIIDKELLRKYIAYARRHISPQLTNGAIEKIKEFYVELRKMSKDVGSVAITPRYLEGLVRLCEANAKMRLSPLAEERDAEVAISLMRYVMKQVMTDKATGLFDVDTVTTGKPKSERERLQKIDIILEIIKTHLKKEDSADIEKVVSDAASYGIDEQTARRIIAELLRRGEIYEKEHGHVRLVGERF